MRSKLAVKARTYYNASTYAAPSWQAINAINDTLNLGLSKDEIDTTDRNDLGWETVMGGLRKCPVDFKIPWKPGDTFFDKAFTAWLADDDAAVIEFAILDGARDVLGNNGIRAYFELLDFKRVEEKNGKINCEITMKPCKATTAYAAPSKFTSSGS